MKELNNFEIIHTDLKPENIAVVLEPDDYPENRIFKEFFNNTEIYLLFTIEIALLVVIFYKFVKSEPLYELMFKSLSKKQEIDSFLKYCVDKKLLLEFLKSPFRENILKICKLLFNQ